MNEPTLEEALETVQDQAGEIERLKDVLTTVKGAANDLRRCLAEFGNEERWLVTVDAEDADGVQMEWRWKYGHPSLLAFRALQKYDATLKAWDDAHPTGAERLRVR